MIVLYLNRVVLVLNEKMLLNTPFLCICCLCILYPNELTAQDFFDEDEQRNNIPVVQFIENIDFQLEELYQLNPAFDGKSNLRRLPIDIPVFPPTESNEAKFFKVTIYPLQFFSIFYPKHWFNKLQTLKPILFKPIHSIIQGMPIQIDFGGNKGSGSTSTRPEGGFLGFLGSGNGDSGGAIENGNGNSVGPIGSGNGNSAGAIGSGNGNSAGAIGSGNGNSAGAIGSGNGNAGTGEGSIKKPGSGFILALTGGHVPTNPPGIFSSSEVNNGSSGTGLGGYFSGSLAKPFGSSLSGTVVMGNFPHFTGSTGSTSITTQSTIPSNANTTGNNINISGSTHIKTEEQVNHTINTSIH